jgi:hypothetical protein
MSVHGAVGADRQHAVLALVARPRHPRRRLRPSTGFRIRCRRRSSPSVGSAAISLRALILAGVVAVLLVLGFLVAVLSSASSGFSSGSARHGSGRDAGACRARALERLLVVERAAPARRNPRPRFSSIQSRTRSIHAFARLPGTGWPVSFRAASAPARWHGTSPSTVARAIGSPMRTLVAASDCRACRHRHSRPAPRSAPARPHRSRPAPPARRGVAAMQRLVVMAQFQREAVGKAARFHGLRRGQVAPRHRHADRLARDGGRIGAPATSTSASCAIARDAPVSAA